jgi:hypothetical protein
MIPTNTLKNKGEKSQSQCSNSITPPSAQMNTNSPSSDIGIRQRFSIEDATIRGISSFRDAQNSIINFSEVFAPLLSAACHVDALKTAISVNASIKYEQDPKLTEAFIGV